METYIATLEREILGIGTGKVASINIVPGVECLTFDTSMYTFSLSFLFLMDMLQFSL